MGDRVEAPFPSLGRRRRAFDVCPVCKSVSERSVTLASSMPESTARIVDERELNAADATVTPM
jgi:hypothetical protein